MSSSDYVSGGVGSFIQPNAYKEEMVGDGWKGISVQVALRAALRMKHISEGRRTKSKENEYSSHCDYPDKIVLS
ncbi:hypothetical protein Tcan_09916 [Toxocara canis]|uniref:Uncharacterized protein n=1 Tax=Toxocara canis TaxID=6265 RepID=A0A0B2V8R7_TOXCA|nr:hypothetical protein Tcan_09916 [Toxocara canis]